VNDADVRANSTMRSPDGSRMSDAQDEPLSPKERALLEEYLRGDGKQWKAKVARRIAEQMAGHYAENRDPLEEDSETRESPVSPPPASCSPDSEEPPAAPEG
jgi:hypothetical protein